MLFMTTRLLILWLLAEQPQHGYRLKAILTDSGFAPWFALEDASIYAMLRSLVKQGLARVIGEEQTKGRPARTLYKITPEGRRALKEGLIDAFAIVHPRPEPIHAALAATDEFEPAELRSAYAARLLRVSERIAKVREQALAAPTQSLVRREIALLEAETSWLNSELNNHDQQWGAPA
jgi:DNA-binding PadR family transcriptional regulator